MLDGIIWFVTNLGLGVYNILWTITHPLQWLNWWDAEAFMRFVYYGGSVEFFFAVLVVVLAFTIAGLAYRRFMWGTVWVLEGFGNAIGRFAAWAGLFMVIQQIVIVFIQRIFTRADISFGAGSPLTKDISWWAEELKLYNAIIVCLACAYTFIQRGHVRVDLVYAAVSYRTKKVIDMLGSLVFMMPMAVLTWMYAWYFMWRHLITPKVNAGDTLDRTLMKARAVRWNIETIGFTPSGFNGYFLFKVLILLFAGMVFIQAVAFLYRSFLEWSEGPDAEGKYLDIDTLEPDDEAQLVREGA